jgi:SAM-dependent methyltransferase
MDASPTATESAVAGRRNHDAQREANDRLWARTDLVRPYATRLLRPAEVIILVRYREALAGRVLELGCGAGRLTGYLAELAAAVHGIDVSDAMLAYCGRAYPGVTLSRLDMRDIASMGVGAFDVVVAGFNVLDILDDADRGRVLAAIHEIVSPGGLLIMSSHNLAYAPRLAEPLVLLHRGLLRGVLTLMRGRRWRRNRRRLLPFEQNEPGYSILNDISHDFGALHYYITPQAQRAQLADHGFELVECLDLDGHWVEEGDPMPTCPELHYVARRVSVDSSPVEP